MDLILECGSYLNTIRERFTKQAARGHHHQLAIAGIVIAVFPVIV
jgi:hypothetical protein